MPGPRGHLTKYGSQEGSNDGDIVLKNRGPKITHHQYSNIIDGDGGAVVMSGAACAALTEGLLLKEGGMGEEGL